MLPMLNRSVVIVRPKQPFLEWLKGLPDPIELTAEDVANYPGTYLLPDFEDDEEQQEVLEHFFDLMFEEMLLGWWTVEDDWPKDRTLTMFNEWFNYELHSVVFDMVDGPLLRE